MTVRDPDALHTEWDEIEPVVIEVFDVWGSGSGLLLAQYAWNELSASKVQPETDVERSDVIIRLLAFGSYYREFCARAFDEGYAGEWRDWITSDLVGDRPLLDVAVVGEPVTPPDASEADFSKDADAVSEVLQQMVQSECGKVIALLKERWGDARFFASLYVTGQPGLAGYPLSEETIGEIVNDDVTFAKQDAWTWVDDNELLA